MIPKRGIEQIYYKGKNIGSLDFDKLTYYSRRSFESHFFNKFSGFGISCKLLDKLQFEGVSRIVLIITDHANQILETNTDEFIVHGIEYVDTSSGEEEKQIILPLKYFNKKDTSMDEFQSRLEEL